MGIETQETDGLAINFDMLINLIKHLDSEFLWKILALSMNSILKRLICQ